MSKEYRTAITRTKVSKPSQHLRDNDLLQGRCLDYGCGKGFDANALDMDSFDPYFNPIDMVGKYDTIMCNFVLNVIESTQDRDNVVESIKALLNDSGVAYISVRNDKKNLNGYTSIGTYQTFVELDYEVVNKTSTFVMYKVKK